MYEKMHLSRSPYIPPSPAESRLVSPWLGGDSPYGVGKQLNY